MTESEATEIAKQVFEGTRYHPSEQDVEKLSNNILLLERHGLGGLNQRLLEGGRKVWDTFVEHNLAAELVTIHGSAIRISYEPPEENPPPDFKTTKEGITFRIQVKNLARLERENRQIKTFDHVRRFAQTIPVSMFFECALSTDFNEADLEGLQKFIAKTANGCEEGRQYYFPSADTPKARLSFWTPRNARLEHLTLGISADMDMAEITGQAKGQIRKSLEKALIAFKSPTTEAEMNLVVLDADRHHDIDICDALYGTEFEIFGQGRHGWSRQKDGLFHDPHLSSRVSGVIAVRRRDEWTPVSSYSKAYYVNENFPNHTSFVKGLFVFGMEVHYNMRPMGKANFNPT